MRWVLLVGVAVVVLGAVFGGGVVLGMALDDGGESGESDSITDAEHDRLLNACMAATSEPASCPPFVEDIVAVADRSGCEYAAAAAVVKYAFRHGVTTPELKEYRDRTFADC